MADANEDATAHEARAEMPGAHADPGSLYVVATPLGHARDVTLRALDILRSVDLIAAEDTRVSAPFLRRYGVGARLVSLHAHNEARRASTIIAALADGRSVALVSDAGTPAISDPGARLVRAVREAGHPIIPIPGPSAISTAISAAGLDADRFAFTGFLPANAKERRELLSSLGSLALALVIYEAPHRIRATLDEIASLLSGERMVVICRELTKTFETIARVQLADAVAWVDHDPNRQRGEFVIIVDAPDTHRETTESISQEAERWLVALLSELSPSRASRVVASMTGVARDALYARALALKQDE